MTTHRRNTSDPADPLSAAILEEAARAGGEESPEMDDPALLELVEEAVAPYASALTPQALAEARYRAAVALLTHPEGARLLEERRRRPVPESSGVRPKLTPTRLVDAARRRRGAS